MCTFCTVQGPRLYGAPSGKLLDFLYNCILTLICIHSIYRHKEKSDSEKNEKEKKEEEIENE